MANERSRLSRDQHRWANTEPATQINCPVEIAFAPREPMQYGYNGSPVELGLFTTPAYKDLSAVIFGNCANMGKIRALSADPNPNIFFTALRLNPALDQPHVIKEPKQRYEENLLDGLRIYHNPYAIHSLEPALFRHRSVVQSYYANNDWIYEQQEGQLLFRTVQTSLPRKVVQP